MRAYIEFPPATKTWPAAWRPQRDDGRAATGPTIRPWRRLLDDYLQGWAEADPIKIIRATEYGYRFDDPLVGAFSRWSLPLYFAELQARFARSGETEPRDLAMTIDRPADTPEQHRPMRCYREAPRLGLTGISLITVGAHGVIAESVAYDANLALEVLRAARAPE
jgi:hypothetical protein